MEYKVLSLILLCFVLKARCESIDQILARSLTEEKNGNMLADMNSGVIRHDLDMMLTIEQYRDLMEDDYSYRTKRKSVRKQSYRWPRKEIPFVLDQEVFRTRADMRAIQEAMDEWEKYTCISFRRKNSRDDNYVKFDNGNGCYSYVGMVGGEQPIGLAAPCRTKGVIVHEIGHAVGFHHEQNRPDRDRYVRIMEQNILPNTLYNFRKYPASKVNTYDVPYDYESVMHYGGTAFSKNGRSLTIKTHRSQHQKTIGNRKGLSFYDIMLANKMYKCDEHCASSKRCPRGSYMGKDCQCWCKGNPIRLCNTPTPRPTPRPTPQPTWRPVTSKPRTCKNLRWECPAWERAGYCRTNAYVKITCRESCGTCRKSIKVTKVVPPRGCRDERSRYTCSGFARLGYCTHTTYKKFMEQKCTHTCGLCKKQINQNPKITYRKNRTSITTANQGNSRIPIEKGNHAKRENGNYAERENRNHAKRDTPVEVGTLILFTVMITSIRL